MSMMKILSKTINMMYTNLMKLAMKRLTSFPSEDIGGKKTWRGMKSTFDNLELFYSEIGEDE